MQIELNKLRTAATANLSKTQKAKAAAEATFLKAKQAYDVAHADHAKATEDHAKILQLFPVEAATKVKGKPGPKAKVKAAVVAAPKGKPGPKAKAKPGPKAKAAPKAAAAPKAKAAPKAAAKTGPKKTRKKADGSLTMVERLVSVIGNKILTAGEMAQGLIAAGDPPTSKNLPAYISSVLSSTLDEKGEKVFVAVERGKYCVAANRKTATVTTKTAAAPKVAAPKAVAAAAPVAAPTEAVSDGQSPADKLLAEMGMSPESFGGSAAAPLS